MKTKYDYASFVGKKLGNSLIIKAYHNDVRWVFDIKCICGSEKTIIAIPLILGNCKGCGCASKKVKGLSHGLTWNSWISMKRRCTDIKNNRYDHYKKRGITLDPAWLDFNNFYKDMGDRPSKKHSIDRIDNNKGYFKENCRWADHFVQARNKEFNKSRTKIKNIELTKNKTYRVSFRRVVGGKNILQYLGTFSSLDEAIIVKNNFHAQEGFYNEIIGP